MALVTKTIGISGRDYSTITSWAAELEGNSGGSGNDAVGEIYNDATFNEVVTIDALEVTPPNSITLTVNSDERHDGIAGTGARIVDGSIEFSVPGLDFVLVEWIEIDASGSSRDRGIGNSSSTGGTIIRNCIVHGSDQTSQDYSGIIAKESAGAGENDSLVSNCLVYNIRTNNGGPSYGIRLDGVVSVFNCTVDRLYSTNHSRGVFLESDNANINIINALVTGISGTGDVPNVGGCIRVDGGAAPSSANVSYCVTSDETGAGTGSVTDASEDQYISRVEGSEDYHLTSISDAKLAGLDILSATPSLSGRNIEIDIDGFNRDTEAVTWDIGSDQLSGDEPPSSSSSVSSSSSISSSLSSSKSSSSKSSSSSSKSSSSSSSKSSSSGSSSSKSGSSSSSSSKSSSSSSSKSSSSSSSKSSSSSSSKSSSSSSKSSSSSSSSSSKSSSSSSHTPTEITKTIGISGRDYSTITTWDSDLDNKTIYGWHDDAIGYVYNDAVYIESPDIDGGTDIDLNTVTLTVPESERHDGTAGTGVRIIPANGNNILQLFVTGSIEWIETDGSNLDDISNLGVRLGSANPVNVTAKNMLIYSIGSGLAGTIGMTTDTVGISATFMNNIVYDITSGGMSNNYGIIDSGADSFTVYNCTINGVTQTGGSTGFGLYTDNNNATIKNNLSVGNDQDYGAVVSISGGVNNSNNISSDATAPGVNSLTSVSSGQFISLVGGSEDYHLKKDSDAISVGIDLVTETPSISATGVQFDIDNFDRTSITNWDVGADQAFGDQISSSSSSKSSSSSSRSSSSKSSSSSSRSPQTITKTIGISDRDYSTITAWEAALDDGAIYVSGDVAIGEVYNDAVYDEGLTFTGGGAGTTNLASATLTVAVGERHDGTAGTGARNVWTASRNAFADMNAIGTFTYEWMDCDANGWLATQQGFRSRYTGGHTIRNNLLHNNSMNSTAGLAIAISNAETVIVNNIIYAWGVRESSATSSNGSAVADYTGDSVNKIVCNNTAYRCGGNSTSSVRGTFSLNTGPLGSYYNNIAMDTRSISEDFIEIGGSVMDYNLSSDATAPGTHSISGATSSDQFVSIVEGAEDLHLKKGSDAYRAGIDLVSLTPALSATGVQFDIDNFNRIGLANWDIGADQGFGDQLSSSSSKSSSSSSKSSSSSSSSSKSSSSSSISSSSSNSSSSSSKSSSSSSKSSSSSSKSSSSSSRSSSSSISSSSSSKSSSSSSISSSSSRSSSSSSKSSSSSSESSNSSSSSSMETFTNSFWLGANF